MYTFYSSIQRRAVRRSFPRKIIDVHINNKGYRNKKRDKKDNYMMYINTFSLHQDPRPVQTRAGLISTRLFGLHLTRRKYIEEKREQSTQVLVPELEVTLRWRSLVATRVVVLATPCVATLLLEFYQIC
jgi:hypothetical protein